MYQNAGFTLIELLVVILIIGILAAVALPQYERVVAKARLSEIVPLVNTLQRAEHVYYMANGEFTRDVSLLDISVPSGCRVNESNSIICGDLVLGIAEAGGWRVGGGSSRLPVHYYRYLDMTLSQKAYCLVEPAREKLGRFLCASLGGKETAPASGNPQYVIE